MFDMNEYLLHFYELIMQLYFDKGNETREG